MTIEISKLKYLIFKLCEQSFDTECETLEEEECNTIYEEICEPVYKVCNFAFKLLTILLSTLIANSEKNCNYLIMTYLQY